MTTYDAIIIGTGQAGPPLARRLAGSGMKVAIIERGRFGGTCINTGCTPTKTLVASAYAVHLAPRSRLRIQHRIRQGRYEACQSTQGLRCWLFQPRRRAISQPGEWEGLRRPCTVVSRREVQVGTEILSADKIFINVVPVPPCPRFRAWIRSITSPTVQ